MQGALNFAFDQFNKESLLSFYFTTVMQLFWGTFRSRYDFHKRQVKFYNLKVGENIRAIYPYPMCYPEPVID